MAGISERTWNAIPIVEPEPVRWGGVGGGGSYNIQVCFPDQAISVIFIMLLYKNVVCVRISMCVHMRRWTDGQNA